MSNETSQSKTLFPFSGKYKKTPPYILIPESERPIKTGLIDSDSKFILESFIERFNLKNPDKAVTYIDTIDIYEKNDLDYTVQKMFKALKENDIITIGESFIYFFKENKNSNSFQTFVEIIERLNHQLKDKSGEYKRIIMHVGIHYEDERKGKKPGHACSLCIDNYEDKIDISFLEQHSGEGNERLDYSEEAQKVLELIKDTYEYLIKQNLIGKKDINLFRNIQPYCTDSNVCVIVASATEKRLLNEEFELKKNYKDGTIDVSNLIIEQKYIPKIIEDDKKRIQEYMERNKSKIDEKYYIKPEDKKEYIKNSIKNTAKEMSSSFNQKIPKNDIQNDI